MLSKLAIQGSPSAQFDKTKKISLCCNYKKHSLIKYIWHNQIYGPKSEVIANKFFGFAVLGDGFFRKDTNQL